MSFFKIHIVFENCFLSVYFLILLKYIKLPIQLTACQEDLKGSPLQYLHHLHLGQKLFLF